MGGGVGGPRQCHGWLRGGGEVKSGLKLSSVRMSPNLLSNPSLQQHHLRSLSLLIVPLTSRMSLWTLWLRPYFVHRGRVIHITSRHFLSIIEASSSRLLITDWIPCRGCQVFFFGKKRSKFFGKASVLRNLCFVVCLLSAKN